MRVLIFLLIFPLFAIGQTIESEKRDSIQIDTLDFPTYSLTMKGYGTSGPAKVFVIPIRSFDSLRMEIPILYRSKKQEYGVYYILGLYDMSQTEFVKRAVTEFLNRIDSTRMAVSGSTFLRLYTWDQANNRVIYQTGSKELSQVDNLHYLNSTKDICKYMACRNR